MWSYSSEYLLFAMLKSIWIRATGPASCRLADNRNGMVWTAIQRSSQALPSCISLMASFFSNYSATSSSLSTVARRLYCQSSGKFPSLKFKSALWTIGFLYEIFVCSALFALHLACFYVATSRAAFEDMSESSGSASAMSSLSSNDTSSASLTSWRISYLA